MKIYPLLLAVATTLVLSGCLQNFKDSELTVVNSSSSTIKFLFNGTSTTLKSGENKTFSDNTSNTGDFRNDVYSYSTIYSNPVELNGLTLATKVTADETDLSGELDFKNNGRKITLDYYSNFFKSVEYDTLFTNADNTEWSGIDSTHTATYSIGAISSTGWTD